MSGLLGPDGAPMQDYMEHAANKRGRPKVVKPIVGDAFANWSGVNSDIMSLPGGGLIGFDTSRLTLADFRKMREHYQIGSSLHILTFMLHQLDWHIECEDKAVEEWCTINLEDIWTRLVRSMSSAFWAGYSANACEWENDSSFNKLRLNKVKDLVPEECEVSWRYVDAATRDENTIAPKVPIFDGIKKRGTLHKIDVENSFWYPLLMENGDYKGKRLLKTAFQPWFFSSIIHLYQNKYFERFGEPVPIGRAPYNDKIKVGDKTMQGHELMAQVISMIRSRSAVVLPNDRSKEGLNDTPEFDYQVEYLESQMRGADFERYLTRLDEEMSLALFTPLLLLRTADSGGFNQGVAHTQVYLWMLNAIAGDFKEYIDKYIIRPMALYNFGAKAKMPRIKFRKLGTAQQETLRAIVQTLIQKGTVKPNTEELGAHIGLDLEEVEQLVEDDKTDSPDGPFGDTRDRSEKLKEGDGIKPASTTKAIQQRIKDQVNRVYKRGESIADYHPTLGYRKQLVAELEANGFAHPSDAAMAFEHGATGAILDVAALGNSYSPDADSFMAHVEGILRIETERLYDAN